MKRKKQTDAAPVVEVVTEPRYGRFMWIDKNGAPLPESVKRHIALWTGEGTGRPMREVIEDLNTCLKAAGCEPEEYNFSMSFCAETPVWPSDYRWIACFPVTGGSEGYYVHL